MSIPTYLQDPTTVAEHAIDEAVTVACIAVADQTRSLGLQAVHALLVLAIDYAWAPNRRATYGEEGKVKLCQHMKKKVVRSLWSSILRTKATRGEAVE